MKKRVVLALLVQLLLVGSAYAGLGDTLRSKPIYGKQARVIAIILEDKHYRKLPFNDSLSSAILDSYVKELDNNKTYFLAADIKSFEKYRTQIDDLTRNENVEPAFEIYNVFRKRYQERMDYCLNHLINDEFDYSLDEYYETERDKEPWARDEAALNDIWRKIIKSQELSLKLAGKKTPEIRETIKSRYERFIKSFTQFSSEDVFGVYMNCIAEAYDPHTNYFTPKYADTFKQQMSLSLEGIGAQLQTDNDYTKVVKILTGGPAEKSAKLHVNDLITGVAQGKDGQVVDVVGWRIDDVIKLIKGPKGTTVRLQVLPAKTGVSGPAQELVFVRDRIKLEDQAAKKKIINFPVDGKNLKFGVISLPSFYMDFEAAQNGDPNYVSTTRDVKRLILELKQEGIDGLVVDLRNNGGGALNEAVDLTGLFIKDGPVVQVKNSLNKIDVLLDDDHEVTFAGPLVILTNRFSASASEIFAGAIQDYSRGIVVGESTFGKGTVQSVVDLNRVMPGEEKVGELKITMQKFYRVTGSSTQHKGVVPDILLPSALSATQFGESASLNALPWDVIARANYAKSKDINEGVLSGIVKSYQSRLKSDQGLRKYLAETNEMKRSLSDTRISLSEAKRKIEIAEAEKKKAIQDKMNTHVTKEGLPATDPQKMDDESLRESLIILGELATRKVG